MKILSLDARNPFAIEQTAAMLVDGFRDISNAWNTLDEALVEVRESLAPERISRIAVDDDNNVQGWIGGIPTYDGYVWELHPMVVRADCRMRGIGRALVHDFEEHVRQRGGLTTQLGTDDENCRTSIGGIDLYPDVLGKVAKIVNLRQHSFEFYRKLGFEIVGVVPDANGFGKPDILMAKRIEQPSRAATLAPVSPGKAT